jgi:hypothetical protein
MGAGVYSQVNPYQVYNGQNVSGTGFFQVLQISPVSHIPPVLHVYKIIM